MTQEELSRIFDEIIEKGQSVEGWGAVKNPDYHDLTRHTPHTVWQRRPPNEPWEKVPGMGEGNATRP